MDLHSCADNPPVQERLHAQSEGHQRPNGRLPPRNRHLVGRPIERQSQGEDSQAQGKRSLESGLLPMASPVPTEDATSPVLIAKGH